MITAVNKAFPREAAGVGVVVDDYWIIGKVRVNAKTGAFTINLDSEAGSIPMDDLARFLATALVQAVTL